MKVNFNQVLKDLEGKTLTEPVNEDGQIVSKEIYFKDVVLGILLNGKIEGVSAKEKMERYILAQKIFRAQTYLDVSVEQVALIKKLIGDNFNPLVVGQCFEILEG
jgi:hypothetical protein